MHVFVGKVVKRFDDLYSPVRIVKELVGLLTVRELHLIKLGQG